MYAFFRGRRMHFKIKLSRENSLLVYEILLSPLRARSPPYWEIWGAAVMDLARMQIVGCDKSTSIKMGNGYIMT